MNIYTSISSAEGMTKILTDLVNSTNFDKDKILNFLNEDEGCKRQFQFYEGSITPNEYAEVVISAAKNQEFKTENDILKRMHSAFKRIIKNPDLLNRKLENIKNYDFKELEDKLKDVLPNETELNLNIFFCLDGYNAGSIVNKNTMCLDVLFWPSIVEDEKKIQGIILHEFHHIGVLYWLNKNESRNKILMNEDRHALAVKLVQNIMGEGAAVYFFNEEQDIYELILEGYGEEVAGNFKGDYLKSWSNIEEKIANFNKLLLDLLEGSSDDYDSLKLSVENYSYMQQNQEALDKVIGKYISSLIDKTMGRQALYESFKNPQCFLNYFNESCKAVNKIGLDDCVIDKWNSIW